MDISRIPEDQIKYRDKCLEAMELESHSGQFLPSDIFDTMVSQDKENYLGKYVPDEFWRLYGKFYYDMFYMPIDGEGIPQKGDRMDLNVGCLIGRLNIFRPKSVLEVGCGFGRCLAYVKANCEFIERLEGLEISPTMIERSREYFRGCGSFMDDMKITQGKAQKLPFNNGEFDMVYTHVCLTHIPPEFIEQVTGEISRVAKNTIVHVERFKHVYEHPNPHRWSHTLSPYYLKLGWHLHEFDSIDKNPEHYTKVMVFTKQ